MAVTRLSHDAYVEIRRRIVILDIRPEERLKEAEWAQKLGVGRLAVREALTQLHGEGSVTRGPKGGFFAAPMNAVDVVEIREVREMLEVTAIRLAETRISAEHIREMEAACDDFAYMVSKRYYSGACEADRRFHYLLIKAAGNGRLLRAYEQSHIPLFQTRLGQTQEYLDDFEQSEREHREIVAAIKANRAERAAEVLRTHLARSQAAVLGHPETASERTAVRAEGALSRK